MSSVLQLVYNSYFIDLIGRCVQAKSVSKDAFLQVNGYVNNTHLLRMACFFLAS